MQKIINNEKADENKDVKKKNETEDGKPDDKKGKIVIKDLKFSSIFDATILAIKEQEKIKKNLDGEVTQSSETELKEKDVKSSSKHKKKHHHNKESKKRKRSNSSSRERKRSKTKSKSKSRSPDRNGYHRGEKHKCREISDKKDKLKHDDLKKHKESRIKEVGNRDRDDEYKRRRKSRDSFYKRDSSSDREDKWFLRDRYRGYGDRERERDKRFREKSEESTNHIDKKKLLEIARKNAIQMMKSGSLPGALTLGPQAQEKVIAAIKSGGKTVEELTDFCKTLSRKEELGELSSISDENGSDSDGEKPFHHPFQIKERPVSITMNIKNSVPLPIKNLQERASELRMQFPVSSGQQHRKTENEWVPVSPKKPDPPPPQAPVIKPPPPVNPPIPVIAPPLPSEIALPPPIEPTPPTTVAAIVAPPPPQAGVQVFPTSTPNENIDIAAIVTQRLSAMRKLQENPNDVQALNSIYKAQKEMNTWAESKQQIGQFTGSTGAQILTQAELASGYQAWARKDQLQTAAPVSGGMGMHLLQKMGWKPGEGLGKEKTGTLEPLLLEVKLDKKGIVAKEEQKKKITKITKPQTVKTLQGKHPVSLLGEYATKSKLGVPQYDLCFECGPDHKKNFLFRVILNNIEYKPQIASPNKKEAKANAALVCLQSLGVLPPTPQPQMVAPPPGVSIITPNE
ncbi:protein son [Holotrichia oblita]|uniref:Protein son n=1 Tax=Holotrichia oblita TaxID=644536 RepID=A0ACB9T0C1_HOLOL|nr:protein son [Holotrichia oblita]